MKKVYIHTLAMVIISIAISQSMEASKGEQVDEGFMDNSDDQKKVKTQDSFTIGADVGCVTQITLYVRFNEINRHFSLKILSVSYHLFLFTFFYFFSAQLIYTHYTIIMVSESLPRQLRNP